jgi:hypothetical protein
MEIYYTIYVDNIVYLKNKSGKCMIGVVKTPIIFKVPAKF